MTSQHFLSTPKRGLMGIRTRLLLSFCRFFILKNFQQTRSICAIFLLNSREIFTNKSRFDVTRKNRDIITHKGYSIKRQNSEQITKSSSEHFSSLAPYQVLRSLGRTSLYESLKKMELEGGGGEGNLDIPYLRIIHQIVHVRNTH